MTPLIGLTCILRYWRRDQVGKNPCGSDGSTGAIALDQHRELVVPFGLVNDQVVASFQIVKGMVFFDLAQFCPGIPFIKAGYKAPFFVGGSQDLSSSRRRRPG